MTHVYILFSIGPVQSAISQARRTQDLFMGSRVLSVLVQAGLYAVQPPAIVIYPSIVRDDLNSPNRFLVHCPGDVEKAETLAQDIHDAIYKQWFYIADETRQMFELPPPKGVGIAINADIWKRQVKHWLEIYRVSVPDTGDYKRDNLKANRLLAARKLVRDFRESDEPGHKCSLTGEHEALHGNASGKGSYTDVQAYWNSVRKQQRNLAILSQGERLCALSLIKRFAHEAIPELNPEGRFPSTSSIASVPFRAAVIEQWDELRAFVDSYLSALEGLFVNVFKLDKEAPYFHRRSQNGETLHPEVFPLLDTICPIGSDRILLKFRSLDGDFLYEEGLQSAALQDYAGVKTSPSLQQLEGIRNALKTLYMEAEKLGIQAPSSYLAVLSMDGDEMGEQAKRFQEASKHTDFSSRLAAFAYVEVPDIVESDVLGRLVYAGGDDVLALLPAEHALVAAENLRAKFAEKFQQEKLHISTGIAFVHRTHPLQAAVLAAKNAQERAKKDYGRNALAVALLQRSGEPLYMGLKWEVFNTENMLRTVEVLWHIVRAMATDVLSHSLAYDIEHVIYTFADREMPAEPRQKEFERMYKRRYQGNDEVYKTDELYGVDLCKAILALGEYGVIDRNSNPSPAQAWPDVINWLRLARFLAGEEVKRVAVP